MNYVCRGLTERGGGGGGGFNMMDNEILTTHNLVLSLQF